MPYSMLLASINPCHVTLSYLGVTCGSAVVPLNCNWESSFCRPSLDAPSNLLLSFIGTLQHLCRVHSPVHFMGSQNTISRRRNLLGGEGHYLFSNNVQAYFLKKGRYGIQQ